MKPLLRLITGRRVNRTRIAELEERERLARLVADVDFHVAIARQCREIARTEYDRVCGTGAHERIFGP